jgi:hypothetical protein
VTANAKYSIQLTVNTSPLVVTLWRRAILAKKWYWWCLVIEKAWRLSHSQCSIVWCLLASDGKVVVAWRSVPEVTWKSANNDQENIWLPCENKLWYGILATCSTC